MRQETIMKLPVILGGVVSLAVSGVAQAAFLDNIHGGVRVNRGDGYVAVRGEGWRFDHGRR
jgi:hypothetical protein